MSALKETWEKVLELQWKSSHHTVLTASTAVNLQGTDPQISLSINET